MSEERDIWEEIEENFAHEIISNDCDIESLDKISDSDDEKEWLLYAAQHGLTP